MFSYDDCINCDGLRCPVCIGFIRTNAVLWNGSQSEPEPSRLLKPRKTTEIKYWCPECEALLDMYTNYCHNCGKQLDWEGVC